VDAPAVLFDIDGTLVDSTYLHTLAWWRALDDAGNRRPMSVLHRLIGMGSPELLTEVLGHDDPTISERQGQHFQRLKGELTLLPGARELLARTKQAGAIVVLATSATERDVADLRRILDADHFVDHLVHEADVDEAKPSPDIFGVALDKAGVEPARALAVGDTRWDIEAAAKAGVGCVCVLTGGWSRNELLGAGAVATYADAAQMVDTFDDGPLAALANGRSAMGTR
jgi:HAD superfamily hydrolase (TIGR01509 family)